MNKAAAIAAEVLAKAEAKAAEELAKAAEELAKVETSTVVDDSDTSNVVVEPEPNPVVVKLVNTAPVAVDDAASTKEDVGVTINVLQNDTDANGDTLSVTNLSQPSDDTAVLNGDNTVLYTPSSGFTGVDTFKYKANDGTEDSSNDATVTVTVSVNTAPVAVDDAASTVEDVDITINVLQNDTDGNGDTLTVTNLTQPADGTTTLNPDNTVEYHAKLGFFGVDTFTYTANDGTGDSNIATVTVTVADSRPAAVDDTASTMEDVGVTVDVLQNDTDANGDTLSVTNLSQPSNGTAVLNGDNTVLYTPSSGFTGEDTFLYKANDGTEDSNNDATVTVTVSADNTAPVAVADAASTLEDVAVTITVLGNDTDADSDSLTVTNLTQPSNGTTAVNGDNTVLYTPGSGFSGVVTFTYTANDGTADSSAATVTITVNNAPVAVNDTATTPEDVAVTVTVLGHDTDANSDALTVTNLTSPSNGTASVNGDNTVEYTPGSGFTGTDTFTYTATDGTADSNVATVTITVTAAGAQTLTLNVVEGWNSKDGANLSTEGSLAKTQTSDDDWWLLDTSGTTPAYFLSLEFDQTVPAGATISSVKVYIDHYEEDGFQDNELTWVAGGGTLSSPSTLGTTTPTVLAGSGNEAVVEWDVTSSIDTVAEANDLKVKITNDSTVGKKTYIDHVYVVVEYTE